MEKRLLEQKLEELKSRQQQINDIWDKTGNRQLLHFFVDIIPRTLNVERCSIFVLDPEEDNVWLQCGTGVQEKSIQVAKWNSVVGEVIETGKPVQVDDLSEKVGVHDVVALNTGFFARDTLCVPVCGVTRQGVTGVIQVLNKMGNRHDADAETHQPKYSDEDKRILNEMAFHLQMQIENIFQRQELIKISQEMSGQITMLERNIQSMSSA